MSFNGGDALLVMDSNYERWNKALVEYFLKPGCTVYLSCDHSVLEDIAKKSPHIRYRSCAVSEFKEAVMAQRRHSLPNPKMEVFSYVGILAFHVYCFYRSEDRGDGTKGFWHAYARELGLQDEKEVETGHRENVREMWFDFKDWIHQQNNLRMNPFVRDSGSWHVVNIIKSHAGLRAADLLCLPKAFLKFRLLPNHLESRAWLESNIEALSAEISRAKTIFEDKDRRGCVRLQVLSFYDSWDGSMPEKQSQEAENMKRMWCQIHHKPERVLEGALLEISQPLVSVDGINEMLGYLEANYLSGLLTVFNPITGRYEEACSFTNSDWVLFFFSFGEFGTWNTDLTCFAGAVTLFRKKSCSNSKSLQGLPENAAALLFRIKDKPVYKVAQAWKRFYAPKHYEIQLEGGLRLEKGRVWLDGAPPSIHCDAGKPRIEPPQSPECDEICLEAGEHHLVNAFSTVRVEIRGSRRSPDEVPSKKWVFLPNRWPVLEDAPGEDYSTLQGGHYQSGLEDDWESLEQIPKPESDQEIPIERVWIERNLKLRGLKSNTVQTKHLLCKALDMTMERIYGDE